MEPRLTGITEGYQDRMARLALFDPLFELGRKNNKDNNNQPIDYFGLGLLTLLFFFEHMLMRNKKVGAKELAMYFQQETNEYLSLNAGGFESLAREIISYFRPTHGKKKERVYFNWDTKQEDRVQYSILKSNTYDPETNSQYYSLDEQGLELVFATKEYFSEFQLSIHQLVLRKQLEKGEFVYALRQIDEMRIDVETLQQRMIKMKHEIQRNIVSEETYGRYKAILEDAFRRLERENEEFDELQVFVKDTKERLYHQGIDQKEPRTYELVVRIARELEEVHTDHRKMLKMSMELKTTALQAAQESLYYVGIDSFNFDQEIGSRVVSSPLPVSTLKGLVAPFLTVHLEETWSPLTVFSEQRVNDEEEEVEKDPFNDALSDEQEDLQREIQENNFYSIMTLLLEALGNAESILLKDFLEYLSNSDQEAVFHHRSFYDFWILLHHRSPFDGSNEEEKAHSFDKALTLIRNKRVVVEELTEILKPVSRYSIQNMKFSLEEI